VLLLFFVYFVRLSCPCSGNKSPCFNLVWQRVSTSSHLHDGSVCNALLLCKAWPQAGEQEMPCLQALPFICVQRGVQIHQDVKYTRSTHCAGRYSVDAGLHSPNVELQSPAFAAGNHRVASSPTSATGRPDGEVQDAKTGKYKARRRAVEDSIRLAKICFPNCGGEQSFFSYRNRLCKAAHNIFIYYEVHPQPQVTLRCCRLRRAQHFTMHLFKYHVQTQTRT
jgi:hypothetical protein